jgi:carbon monoxide dehydrogenase subunit G
MAQIETSILIHRSRQDVFDFVLDLEHAIGIDPDIESIEKTSPGPAGTGTEFSVRQKVPPFGRISNGVSRFTAVDPPRTIAIEAELGPIRPTGRFAFEDVDGSTRVTVAIDPNAAGLFRLLSPLIARKARHVWEQRLVRMKRILES